MIHSMSESVIVAALRSGNVRRAMELLLDAYQDEVYGYCACLVGPKGATDLYHRVLAAAIEQLNGFEGSTSMRAWLFGLARTTAVAIFGQTRSVVSTMGDGLAVASRAEEIPGLRLRDELLEEVFGALPLETREILELVLWHGLHLAEVAHVVGRTSARVQRLATEGLFSLAVGLRRSAGAPS
jgi:RNA polymerase sigma factor (sigma-70 family)